MTFLALAKDGLGERIDWSGTAEGLLQLQKN